MSRGAAGIRGLGLKAAAGRLEDLRRFYSRGLGLEVESAGAGIVVKAGGTLITFEPFAPGSEDGPAGRDAGVPSEPYYHFAFNIPENRLAASKAWLRGRAELLRGPDGGDEYHFVSWNAHAVYFLDPAGNILEFIARHNLENAAEGEFSSADILYASEIALVVDDVDSAVEGAREKLGLGVFAGSRSARFAAVGDDHRLLIIVERGREWNSGHGRAAEMFPLRAQIAGAGRFESGMFDVAGV